MSWTEDDSFFRYGSMLLDENDENTAVFVFLQFVGNKWQVTHEGYTGDYPVERDLDDEHFASLLKRFSLVDGLLPRDSLLEMRPPKLRALADTIEQLGGPDRFHTLVAGLEAEGELLHDYIGSGGWGHVFRGTSRGHSGAIALKVLAPPYQEGWKRRFAKESAALAALQGLEGVVRLSRPVREVGRFLVLEMEYVDGTSVQDLGTPLGIRRAWNIARELLQILAPIHKRGFIHRDLHAGNAMIARGSLVLLDFGLVRDCQSIEEYKTFRPLGSMTHCAPEKWLDASNAGPASDVFSVGVMLFRMLSGQTPYWSDTYIGLYEKIRAGERRKLSEVAKEVPEFLDLVIAEMLNTDVNRRPRDAAEAAAFMDRIEPMLSLWEEHVGGRGERVTNALHQVRPQPEPTEKLTRIAARTREVIGTTTGVSLAEFGVHVFLLAAGLDDPGIQVMRRVARSSKAERAASSRVEWRYARGVVGQCWASERFSGKDLATEDYRSCTQHDWAERFLAGDDFCMGMSYDEFRSTDWFSAVFAAPIVNQTAQVIGCVSLNVELGVPDAYGRIVGAAKEVLQHAAWEVTLVL
jgi:hypothetical protein